MACKKPWDHKPVRESIQTTSGYRDVYTCSECGRQCPSPLDQGKLQAKSVARSKARKSREAALRSIGLTKVRGNLGGTYWE